MGNPTVLEYESLDNKTLSEKTQPGGIKHNGEVSLESGESLFRGQTRQPEGTEAAADMANDLLIQSDSESSAAAIMDGAALDITFGIPIEEKPIWADLYESIRDIFFPPKLPPLELTSTPIPVPDRMAVKPNPWAIGISTTFNLTILAIALFFGAKKAIETFTKPPLTATPIDIADWKAPQKSQMAGGGGGSHDNIEAVKGKIPPRMKALDPTPKVEQPPLPSIDVQPEIVIPNDVKLPNFGMSNSTNVKLASGGNGSGMGIGSGNGNGYGPGSGGNIGSGVYQIGGGVSEPKVIFSVDPEFSDEARRAKYQGVVLIALIVDAQGNPQGVHVARALGMGLDEKAMEAVRQFKFKPALKEGKPVACYATVEVNFRLY
ncbi:MAG: TonB family protein [Terracidiphilus sp.]|jgi:TonB family protein